MKLTEEQAKKLVYYQKLPYRLEIIPDTKEGGYAARYPQLNGCITCGDTISVRLPPPSGGGRNHHVTYALRA